MARAPRARGVAASKRYVCNNAAAMMMVLTDDDTRGSTRQRVRGRAHDIRSSASDVYYYPAAALLVDAKSTCMLMGGILHDIYGIPLYDW